MKDLFGETTTIEKQEKVIIKNGEYIYIPKFFSENESIELFSILKNQVAWKQESMKMYGKQVNFPRLTAWYGDQGKEYTFSGITLHPNNWTNEILHIKNKIEDTIKYQFNSVLLNQYRNGEDSISWHTDAEPELGLNPVIASVTFGATRNFQLRHIETDEKIEIPLSNGSLLVMQGALQHFWKHQIPKSKKVKTGRINLTFRSIL